MMGLTFTRNWMMMYAGFPLSNKIYKHFSDKLIATAKKLIPRGFHNEFIYPIQTKNPLPLIVYFKRP